MVGEPVRGDDHEADAEGQIRVEVVAQGTYPRHNSAGAESLGYRQFQGQQGQRHDRYHGVGEERQPLCCATV